MTIAFTEDSIQQLFGHEAAEDENPSRLKEYYFKSSVFKRMVTDQPFRILVGHKGIGKSALLKVAIAEDQVNNTVPVFIQPNDILDLGIDTHDFLKTVRSWQRGLSNIVVRKALRALELDGFSPDRSFDDGNPMSVSEILRDELLSIETSRYPDSQQERIWALIEGRANTLKVYIDDLDRGWQGRKEDVTRISALLNAIRDITRESKGVQFRIALRSDVYYLVRTSDESTDKIEGSVIWHTWTNHEIFALLVKRVETFFGRNIKEESLLSQKQPFLAKYLDPIMEPKFRGSGIWDNAPTYKILMSLIRKRPRDLVKLCTLAARSASNRKGQRISSEDFQNIFEEYSQNRIQDTINEYRSELPEIERLVMSMKPNKKERTTRQGYVYKTDSLLNKIEDVIQLGDFRFTNGKKADKQDLAQFMFKINFLTARKEVEGGQLIRKYFEENRYLSNKFVDFGFDWEIHPAYRWALQPVSIESYLPALSSDD